MEVTAGKSRLSWSVVAFGLALELAIGVAGLAAAWMLKKNNLLAELMRRSELQNIAFGIALGLAAALLLWLAVRLVRALQRSRSMRILIILKRATWPQAILLCAAAALGEEVLFRGALQPSIGIPAAALLFGLLHAYGKLYVVVAIAAGVGLGYLYLLTGSLAAAIAAHAAYNLAIVTLLKLDLFPISNEIMSKESAPEAASEAV